MQFLPGSDQKQASLVCKNWYSASLHPCLRRDRTVKSKPLNKDLLPLSEIKSKVTYMEFGDHDGRRISEEAFVSLLRSCPSLEHLNLSGCNSLFLSGRLLSKPSNLKVMRENLSNLRILELGHLRHMTDVTFERLVSVMENIEQISLSSTHMIFGSCLYYANQSSPAMLHFKAFLKFVHERASKLKSIDLSHTAVHDEALESLASISNLALDEISLKGCSEVSDKGLSMLVTHQHSLKVLDISNSSKLGTDAEFFTTMANNLPHLHTLIMRKCAKISQCDVHSLAGFGSLHTLDIGEVLRFHDRDLIFGLCFQGPRLTSLVMTSCPDISDDFIIHLCKSSYNLINLDLSSCTKLTDASVHAITRNLTSLQSLRLSHCREISDMGILGYIPENGIVPRHSFDFDHDACPCTRERDSKIFQKPSGLTKAHKSCMYKPHFNVESGAEMFMLSNLKSLRILDLSFCPRITDVGLGKALRFKELSYLALNGLPRLNDKALMTIAHQNISLETVELAESRNISDTAVSALTYYCTQLSSLNVSKCPALSEKCLKAIEVNCKKLCYLDLSCNNMAESAVEALQSRLPQMNLVFRFRFE